MIRYALAPDGARHASLGRHLVVFNPVSWETHLLNAAAGEVLLALADRPQTVAEIGALLADLLAPEERSSAAAHAEATLQQLQALGLAVASNADAH